MVLDEIRFETMKFLRNTKSPSLNTSKYECANSYIVVLSAANFIATVGLYVEDKNSEVNVLLQDGSYNSIAQDHRN